MRRPHPWHITATQAPWQAAPHLSLCAALISFIASLTLAAGSMSVTSTWVAGDSKER